MTGAISYRPRPGTIPTLTVPSSEGWRRLHLVGMGGAGMSGIARLLLGAGVEVSGSDLKDSPGLQTLRGAGAAVFVGHAPDQIGDPDAVVVSTAIPLENTEVREARRRGIQILSRAQVLAALSAGRTMVAVSGTHGKTTTTSLLAVMLSRAGLDPTYVIGGDLNESGSGAVHGAGDVFVAEADESDGSFLLLRPDIGVITNIEQDHLDFYAGVDEIEAAFASFARQCGAVVACWDDPGVRRAVPGTAERLVRYGLSDQADVRVVGHELRANGAAATIELEGELVDLDLSVRGLHNVLNAAAALAVASVLGVPLDRAVAGLGAFSGVRRRFEERGHVAGARFVDDYAHHPSEVAATLDAARLAGARRTIAVFQPHRYTRTAAMWRPLGESLGTADMVVLTDVYGAGEAPIPGVTGKLLVEALAEAEPGKRVVYLPRRSEVAPFLVREVRHGDLVLTLGAGDITMVGEEALEHLLAREADLATPLDRIE